MLINIEMEKKIKKKVGLKKILLLVLLLSFVFALTGCESIPTKSKTKDNAYVYENKDGDAVINIKGTTEKLKDKVGWMGSYNFTDNYKTAEGKINADLKGSTMRDVARLMLNSTFGDDIITHTKFNKYNWSHFTTEPIDLIQKVNQSTIDNLQNNKALDKVIKVVQSTAAAILITVWSMGFISQIVNEKFSMETLLKTLMQLMCGILIVTNAKIFTEAFVGTGNLFLNELSSIGQKHVQFGAFKQELTDMLANIDFSVWYCDIVIGKMAILNWSDQSMSAILLLIFPFIMQLICAYKIVSMMIMRTFEIMIRTTFAPIPLAFSAQNGFSEGAIRYFRGILACAMQPVLMIVGACCLESIVTIVMQIFGGGDAGSITQIFGGGDAGSITGFTASLAMGISYFILSTFFGQIKQLSNEVIAH